MTGAILFMSYRPFGSGGVVIRVHDAGRPDEHIVALPHSREQAIQAAGHILAAAGVREATFKDGRLSGVR